MIVKYFETPCPHFIIDNFLPNRASQEILQEVIDLESQYTQAGVGAIQENLAHKEESETCKLQVDISKNTIRDNQVIYLDHIFAYKRDQSKTLTYLNHKICEDFEFINEMEKANHMFPLINTVNTSETLVSRYGKCDFYGWHYDTLSHRELRLITISYYVNKEPLQFDGGRIMFYNKETKEKKAIEPKHNRAVIFMSTNALHSVEHVNLSGKKWEEGRFSVQFWLGFNNQHKFRD